MRFDYHMHTQFSDGALSLEALLGLVRQAQLKSWALTDHDTLVGVRQLQHMGVKDCVSGVEITCVWQGEEVHVVGLGVSTDDHTFEGFLQNIRQLRCRRMLEICHYLRQLGAPTLELHDLGAEQCETKTRHHIALALVKAGWAPHVGAVFAGPLSDDAVRHLGLSGFPCPTSAVEAIHAAGGVAILAHPGHYNSMEKIAEIAALGLDGLEVRHPRLSPPLRQGLDALVRERNYLQSCGSAFHYPGSRRLGDWHLPKAQIRPLWQRLGLHIA